MKVLLDENLPVPLRHNFPGHEIATVTWMGRAGIVNGRLLDLAEAHNFGAFITVDSGLPFQQAVKKRSLAIIILIATDNSLETLQPLVPAVHDALKTIEAGEVMRVGD